MGLIVAGPGLTTRPNAIETPTLRKRRKDRMKGKLEPLVRFGAFKVFSERAWQRAKGTWTQGLPEKPTPWFEGDRSGKTQLHY